MNYTEDFRDKKIVLGLAARIKELTRDRSEPMTFMEVCGTHTMAIYQFGIRSLLPRQVRLISGPGCPVCVTPNGYLDKARQQGQRVPKSVVMAPGEVLKI